MQDVLNLEKWIAAVERIGFEKALVLILLLLLCCFIAWLLVSHGGKLTKIKDGICGVDHKFDILLAVEKAKAEGRDDASTKKIIDIVDGLVPDKACDIVDMNQGRKGKSRMEQGAAKVKA